ncbi:MAG: SH3 domain-containing protein [Desulfovibrionaceae bacterium]|nr:SH3 domain-containing protein [Desulfovibrionaceae bacterium]
MPKRIPAICASLALVLLLAACGTRDPYAPVQDLTELPQDAGAYHHLPPDERLLKETAQQAAWDGFMAAHFDPWTRNKPKNPAEKVFWGLSAFEGKRLFGENTLPLDAGWLDRMRAASRVNDFPGLHRRAVTVTNASLRVLPTHRPAFYDFRQAGEGFPFDYMQNSLVLAGTPLLATHVSADRAWVLVECRFAYGWVRATDIAWVDDAFAAAYQSGAYLAVTRDDVPLTDLDGRYRFTTHVGALFPVTGSGPDGRPVIGVPVRDDLGNAVLHAVEPPEGTMQPAPIPATPANFARIANAMLGRAYGWGGLYEDRDCSALAMDLMAGFGILLPRNSSQQIRVGTKIALDGMDRDGKRRLIAGQGTPFLTLIRKPGHIMVYLGDRGGEPVVLHATWGLKTETGGGYGRKVIGGAVITTLEPGLELDDLARPEGILLETVRAMTTLP